MQIQEKQRTSAGVLALVSSCGLYLKVSCEPKPFFKKPKDLWTDGIVEALMSYILFWTLFYDIVHIY